jgi:ribonuclease BN (tRNA processing enzyme)
VTELVFLGTGNFLAPPGRYWNSFMMDGNVLVEPCPTALPHLRRCGFGVEDVEVVVVSHFHADHCFGWPFLCEALAEAGGGRTVWVVGPPGIEGHLVQMNEAGAVATATQLARQNLDLRFVEVDGMWQTAGPLRFRAVEVDHVPYLRCFGYLFDRTTDGEGTAGSAAAGEDTTARARIVGYSGDTTPCPGLDELATEADVLVVECNGKHGPPEAPPAHMDEDSVGRLREAHPGTHLILTHLGEQVDTRSMAVPGVTVPNDFDRLTV